MLDCLTRGRGGGVDQPGGSPVSEPDDMVVDPVLEGVGWSVEGQKETEQGSPTKWTQLTTTG